MKSGYPGISHNKELRYWSFLAVDGVISVACQGFLVREVCVSVLVGGVGILSGVQ